MRRLALTLVVGVAAVPAAATTQDLTYSGSVQYSTGSWLLTEPLRTVSLYSGLALTTGPLRLSVGVPLVLAAPVEAEVVVDTVALAAGAHRLTVGDPFLSGGLELYAGGGVVRSVELTGSAKLPLGDLDSGVSTGEWDYAVGGSAAAALGPVLTFVDVAYWWYGDLPELDLRDGLGWGGGLSAPVSRSVWVSVMATGADPIVAGAAAASTASLGITWHTAGSGALSLTAGAGLSETSPDYVLALGWRRSLVGRR